MMISEKNKVEKSLGGFGLSLVVHFGILVLILTAIQKPLLQESGDNIAIDYRGQTTSQEITTPDLGISPLNPTPSNGENLSPTQVHVNQPPKEVPLANQTKSLSTITSKKARATTPNRTQSTPLARGKVQLGPAIVTPSEALADRDLREEILKEETSELLASKPIVEPYMVSPTPEPVAAKDEPAVNILPAPAPLEVRQNFPTPSTATPADTQVPQNNLISTSTVAGQGPGIVAPPTGNPGLLATPGTGTPGPQVRSDDILKPIAGNQPPIYPPADRLNRNAGEIIFRYFVNSDGTVKDIGIEKGTGHKSLDLAALKAMKAWRYYPGQEGWARKGFQFNLSGEVEVVSTRGGLLPATASQPTNIGF